MTDSTIGQTVFLFGAGASYGAGNINPPPLGNMLYNCLAAAYPDVWGVNSPMNVFANDLQQDFERTMFNKVCLYQPSLTILESYQKMALYFSKFVSDGSGKDLYSRLISTLLASGKVAQTIFSSLNYDCIFESVLEQHGLTVDYSLTMNGTNKVRVLKPHGSCNFITPDVQRWLPQMCSPGSHIGCGLEALAPSNIEQTLGAKFDDGNKRFFPVMSLYAFGKNSLVGGTDIQQIRNALRERILRASRVAIIGVKANCSDHHIWMPMQETKAKIFYIGDDESFALMKTTNCDIEHISKTFKEGFAPMMDRLS